MFVPYVEAKRQPLRGLTADERLSGDHSELLASAHHNDQSRLSAPDRVDGLSLKRVLLHGLSGASTPCTPVGAVAQLHPGIPLGPACPMRCLRSAPRLHG